MTLLARLVRVIDRLASIGARLAAGLLALTVVLILTEVVIRWAAYGTTEIAEEYAGYFLAAMVYLGAAKTLRDGEHIRMDLLRDRLSPASRRRLDAIVAVIGSALAGLLTYAFALLFWDSVSYESRSFFPSRTPMALPQSAALLGSLLLTLALLAEALRPLVRSGDGASLQHGEKGDR